MMHKILTLITNKCSDVEDLRTRDGKDIYLRRFKLFSLFGISVRLHHIILPDDSEDFHNHPWNWFTTVILSGGYVEEFITTETKIKKKKCKQWSFSICKDPWIHRIDRLLSENGSWSLFIHPRANKEWGFFHRKQNLRPIRAVSKMPFNRYIWYTRNDIYTNQGLKRVSNE